MLLWRRNFLHTAIMRLMVPNTPHRDRHPASPAGWAVWFFFWFFFLPPTGMSGSRGGPTDMCLHQWISADMSSSTQPPTAKKKQSEERAQAAASLSAKTNWNGWTGSNEEKRLMDSHRNQPKSQNADGRTCLTGFTSWVIFPAILCTDSPKGRTWVSL